MSNRIARRTALGTAVFGVLALAVPLHAAKLLAIPRGTMRLTRVLERSLRDGKSIVVWREWLVTFERLDARIAIKGFQESVSVEAPEKLAAIAELEERRDTSAMFPILLSESGLIVSAGAGNDAPLVADAVEAGEAVIDKVAKPAGEKMSAKAGLMQLQQASETYLGTLPGDLFFPKGEEVQQRQELALDQGLSGTVELAYRANPSVTAPWLSTAERQIVTTIGEGRRISRETWSMKPA